MPFKFSNELFVEVLIGLTGFIPPSFFLQVFQTTFTFDSVCSFALVLSSSQPYKVFLLNLRFSIYSEISITIQLK